MAQIFGLTMTAHGSFVSERQFPKCTSSNLPGYQFLVTDYQASIMSNLIAMALTLAGPRLWILIKPFSFWVLRQWRRHHGRNKEPREMLPGQTMDIIEESHSELSAALRLVVEVVRRLRPRIELSDESTNGVRKTTRHRCYGPLASAWRNFLSRPCDIVVSLLLSSAFVGIFVAGSSGSVLSAGIVSDTTALASSRHCFPPDDKPSALSQAASYSQQCYKKSRETEGCQHFYQQYIAYSEKAIHRCPLRYGGCAVQSTAANNNFPEGDIGNQGQSAARDVGVSFDTGFVESNVIGINAPKRYSFRRTATCAPSTSFMKRYDSFGFAIGRFVTIEFLHIYICRVLQSSCCFRIVADSKIV